MSLAGVFYSNLGDAKHQAMKNAKRDDCKWCVVFDSYYTSPHFYICSEFQLSQRDTYQRVVATIAPKKEVAVSPEAVLLTPEEKALVAAVLDPSEPGRDYYEGTEKAKRSLWSKLIGKK